MCLNSVSPKIFLERHRSENVTFQSERIRAEPVHFLPKKRGIRSEGDHFANPNLAKKSQKMACEDLDLCRTLYDPHIVV
jgi:hypothetical protein